MMAFNPDRQYQEPEVFESSDDPEDAPDQNPAHSQPQPQTIFEGVVDEGIDTTGVSASEAFEIFCGKSQLLTGIASKLSRGNNTKKTIQRGRGSSRGQRQSLSEECYESPAQRFWRLQNELQALRDELECLHTNEEDRSEHKEGSVVSDKDVESLQQELLSLGQDTEWKGLLNPLVADLSAAESLELQQALSRRLLSDLERLKANVVNQDEQVASNVEDVRKEANESPIVTYEVYYMPTTDGSVSEVKELMDLESRIAKLERSLGGQFSQDGSLFDLHAAIQHMEERIAMMDLHRLAALDRTLEKLNLKMTAALEMRQELAEIDRAMSTAMDAKVNSVFEKMEECEAAASELPEIMEFLQTTSIMYRKNFTLCEQVERIQHEQSQMANVIRIQKDLIRKIEANISTNVERVAINVENMEARIRALVDRFPLQPTKEFGAS